MSKNYSQVADFFLGSIIKKIVAGGMKKTVTSRHIWMPHIHRSSSLVDEQFLERSLEDELEETPFKNPAILCDSNTKKIYGDKVAEALGRVLSTDSITTIVKDVANVTNDEASAIARDYTFDALFAVGGGKILDLGKIVSYKRNLLFNVPTSMAHDGMATACASISENGVRKTIMAKSPNALILDYAVVMNAPGVEAGIGDAIAKYTSSDDWRRSHEKGYHCGYSNEFRKSLHYMSRFLMAGIELFKKDFRTSEKFYDILLSQFIASGFIISAAGDTTVPASGSEHAICHSFEKTFPEKDRFAHGIKCALGTMYCAYLQKQNWKRVRHCLDILDISYKLKDYTLSPEEFMLIVDNSKRENRYTVLDEVSRKDKEKAMYETGMI